MSGIIFHGFMRLEIGGEKAIIKKRSSKEDEITFIVALRNFMKN
jgi:hypothetical protein